MKKRESHNSQETEERNFFEDWSEPQGSTRPPKADPTFVGKSLMKH